MGVNNEILEISNLSKIYRNNNKSQIILDNINLTLNKGEIFGLIGKIGSGKSTFLKILGGYEPFDDGFIKINGSTNLRKYITYYPQHYFKFFRGTVIDNLMEKLELKNFNIEKKVNDDKKYQDKREFAESLLRKFNLIEKSDKKIIELTSSEKQLLTILDRLFEGKNLLIFDHPWTMGDPLFIQNLMDYVKNFCSAHNISAIIASNNINELKYLCDKVGILINGKLEVNNEAIDQFIKQIPNLFPFKPLDIPEASNSEFLIQLKDIFIKNNFKHLTLDIFKGEILGIIGKNNSDKTLLLKVISGQYIPDSGKIFYLGNNMTEISRFGRDQINILKKFGIVNQEIPEIKGLMVRDFISLIHRFKLAENIDYAIKKYQDMNLKLEILDFLLRISVFPWNISEKKIEDLGLSKEKLFEIFKELKKEELEFRIVAFLENFNIPKEILTKMIDETSFVEQKLIILAAILSLKPSILILDEFDADMDIITKRLVVNNLLKINSQYQTTIIFSTHDPSFLKDLSHRSLILENGKITEINTPEIIYTKFLETMKNSLKYSLVL